MPLALEQIHLCEVIAGVAEGVAEGWCEATPDLRMLEHSGHFLAHRRLEVDGERRRSPFAIWPTTGHFYSQRQIIQ